MKNANSVLSIVIYCPPAYICIFNFKTLTSFGNYQETPTIHATQVFPTLYSSVRIHVPLNALKTETLKKSNVQIGNGMHSEKKRRNDDFVEHFFFFTKVYLTKLIHFYLP